MAWNADDWTFEALSLLYNSLPSVLSELIQTAFVAREGNYVLAVSERSFGGAATSFYDLWRVENGKVTEHWDVVETIAAKDTWQNQNGKF